jgi:hypothetical protein
MKNRRLEIIILPAEEQFEAKREKAEVENIVDSLTGILPDTGMSLEDYRAGL